MVVITSPALQSLPCKIYLAAPADTKGQASTTEFIDNIEKSSSAAIHRLITLVVNPPHVSWASCSQQLPRTVWGTGTLPLTRRKEGPLEPLPPPNSLYLLVIDAPAVEPQLAPNPLMAPAPMAPRQLPDPAAQLAVLNACNGRRPPFCVAVLAR